MHTGGEGTEHVAAGLRDDGRDDGLLRRDRLDEKLQVVVRVRPSADDHLVQQAAERPPTRQVPPRSRKMARGCNLAPGSARPSAQRIVPLANGVEACMCTALCRFVRGTIFIRTSGSRGARWGVGGTGGTWWVPGGEDQWVEVLHELVFNRRSGLRKTADFCWQRK